MRNLTLPRAATSICGLTLVLFLGGGYIGAQPTTLKTAVALLRGVADERLERRGLERTPTFGALADHGEEWLTKLLQRCVTAGWVSFEGGDRPVVVLTEEGTDVMKALRPARLLLPPKRRRGTRSRSTAASRGRGRQEIPQDALDEQGQRLFEALRAHRLEIAKIEGVPPYVVASDRTLRDIATFRPTTPEQLLMANGIGPAKLEKYGAGLLEVVRTQI